MSANIEESTMCAKVYEMCRCPCKATATWIDNDKQLKKIVGIKNRNPIYGTLVNWNRLLFIGNPVLFQSVGFVSSGRIHTVNLHTITQNLPLEDQQWDRIDPRLSRKFRQQGPWRTVGYLVRQQELHWIRWCQHRHRRTSCKNQRSNLPRTTRVLSWNHKRPFFLSMALVVGADLPVNILEALKTISGPMSLSLAEYTMAMITP